MKIASYTYGCPQRRQCFESAACWSSGSASESSSTPKYVTPSRSRPRSATSGSSAHSTSSDRPARSAVSSPAVGQRLELAVAVELIAKEVAEDEHPRIELAGHRHEPR